ncbi:nuclear transport factor 2 family protein [Tsukamurella sp. PLM1]|uniref:nuclear transport factor 2 family protein n=1 Tax=Tsukamurella sp. PLM1 TaxID=2929795 RepID=UPI00206A8A18|nr:nuclear transport factor 2 family protein [Tsukamurella sp. PLM1]BDH56651.1 polyketide cyclase [Tsukamurella sp. PLM1]
MHLNRRIRNAVSALFTVGALVFGAAAQASAAPSTPKELVTAFYTEGFVQRDIAGAAQRYIGDHYIQHNPEVADGREALVKVLGPVVKDPKYSTSIVRIVADGDIVVVYARSVYDGKAQAVADIFRVANGKIVEHWDVIQEDPGRTVSGHPFIS